MTTPKKGSRARKTAYVDRDISNLLRNQTNLTLDYQSPMMGFRHVSSDFLRSAREEIGNFRSVSEKQGFKKRRWVIPTRRGRLFIRKAMVPLPASQRALNHCWP
jgi:hypothetical protein